MKPENWQRAGFGIYVHWPFCQAKCPYCDFNSHVSANVDQSAWVRAYLSELDRLAELTPNRVVSSIFFGGGTPSLMLPETVSAIIDRIQKNWRFTNDVEITLEANPTSVEANRFKGFRHAGVNRISMGIQALNDADLKLLGRLHTVTEAEHAFDIARTTFDRVSFDLIYARQNQSLADWEAELTLGLTMAADHLSLYQLTIEDGTAFGDRFARGGLLGLPHEDLSADLYELTQTITEAHGFAAYEVSNHAKPGQESRHNLIYWRGGDYVGVGPGAHGRFDVDGKRKATETHLGPAKWLESVSATGTGETNNSHLSKEEQALEYLLMSLRLAEGCDLDWLRSLDRNAISTHKIKELSDTGHLEVNQSKLTVPARSRILLNTILAQLVT
ncbi:radical SAM family heme chaperone HemW [Litoreibacter ascidiaceicola]|uniref:radical SAM family heme chaperone HemW n=1 Tax=Litoreibacter ascidiaceicola TaxID=1486859 RepID=UPI00093525D3|nr:radical SAM family heme chaperone HemW [Litoreibacter ascidiaceicola]